LVLGRCGLWWVFRGVELRADVNVNGLVFVKGLDESARSR
jgi:hypothetical protein